MPIFPATAVHASALLARAKGEVGPSPHAFPFEVRSRGRIKAAERGATLHISTAPHHSGGSHACAAADQWAGRREGGDRVISTTEAAAPQRGQG